MEDDLPIFGSKKPNNAPEPGLATGNTGLDVVHHQYQRYLNEHDAFTALRSQRTPMPALYNPITHQTISAVDETIENSARIRMDMLMMRLRIGNGRAVPDVATFHQNGKVFVFLVKDGKPAVLEDDASMYPSDTLVTQLRLIL